MARTSEIFAKDENEAKLNLSVHGMRNRLRRFTEKFRNIKQFLFKIRQLNAT